MIIVTGGAGFIGSNLVRALNRRGRNDILLVDQLTDAPGDDAKRHNLSDLRISDYIDKHEFIAAVERELAGKGHACGEVTAVLHQGACADTMETDEDYVLENNLAYSKALYQFCMARGAQFIYASSASVYGGGTRFAETPQNESALNVYARSKMLFDQFIRAQPRANTQCAGLRYFNVYGPREQHKGTMASVAWHFFNQYRSAGEVRLFEGSGGYADGEQQRDFVSVEDVVAVNLFLLDNPNISGIYNVGSGRARSFNQVALAVINACRRERGEPPTSVEQAVDAGEITYIPMPQALVGKYQNYTCADLANLRAAGYASEFLDVAQGVGRYVAQLLESSAESSSAAAPGGE